MCDSMFGLLSLILEHLNQKIRTPHKNPRWLPEELSGFTATIQRVLSTQLLTDATQGYCLNFQSHCPVHLISTCFKLSICKSISILKDLWSRDEKADSKCKQDTQAKEPKGREQKDKWMKKSFWSHALCYYSQLLPWSLSSTPAQKTVGRNTDESIKSWGFWSKLSSPTCRDVNWWVIVMQP